ncbi:hypothetical protein KJ885_00590 [Patescibacteria group bacterium]|nr:hypothetical protein [Patescibacteria group bacterium]
MDKWEKYLQGLGLSETESKIYLEVLKMGPSAVQEIAKVAGLSRVSVYSIIESLTKLGLMTSVQKGKKQLYAVEPPERLINLADKKANAIERMKKEIKEQIQELKLIQAGDKPIVKMYEGPEAFMAMQEDLLNLKSGKICEFGNLDEINRVYPYERLKPFHQKLAKKKIDRKIIYQTKEKLTREKEPGKQIKYLNNKIKTFRGDFFFYDDTVWLSNFSGKQITVMIKSKEIKETLQAAFDILWDCLK